MIRIISILLFLSAFLTGYSASKSGYQVSPVETIHMATDRDVYVAGENLFFRLNILSADASKSNICYVVLRNSAKTILNYYFKVDKAGEGYSSFYLPDTLKTGYYEIVAFTNYMRNFGESCYFRKQIMVVNRFDEWLTELSNSEAPALSCNENQEQNPLLKISVEKESYSPRENIQLQLSPEQEASIKNLSVAVKSLNPYSCSLISNPATTLKNEEDNPDEIKFKKEIDGVYIYGRLLSADSLAVENACMFVSTIDSFPNLQYCFTSKSGSFEFLLNNFYAGRKIFISTRDHNPGKYSIAVDDKFSLKTPFIPQKIQVSGLMRKYIFNSQNIVKIQKSYYLRYVKNIAPAKPDVLKVPYVYRNASLSVYPANYLVLNNLNDISENLLTGFRIRAKDGVKCGFVVNNADWNYFKTPAATFLNGVYIYNLDQLMNLNSGDIKKLELVNSEHIKGNISFPGVVSIVTHKETDYSRLLPDAYVASLNNFLETSFYNPPRYKVLTRDDQSPDFRQLLYWNPSVPVEKTIQLEFYASDLADDYLVEVKGYTPSGKVISSYAIIKVRK